MRKRFLSLILTLAMVLTMIPLAGVSVYADNATVSATLSSESTKVGEYSTIKAAVEAYNNVTTPGAYTITVNAGTYDEADMIIEQRATSGDNGYHLTIKPADNAAVTIAPGATQYGKVFMIDGKSSERSNNSFTVEGITFNMANTTISKKTIDNKDISIRSAIWFLSGGAGTGNDPLIGDHHRYGHDVTIKKCTFYGLKDQTYSVDFEKYMLAGSDNNSSPANLLIDNCKIIDAGYAFGGYIEETTGYGENFGLKITNTTVTNCKTMINNQGNGTVTVDNCTVQTMHDYVIRTNGQCAVTVTNSVIDTSHSDKTSGGIVVIRNKATNVSIGNCVFKMPANQNGWHHVTSSNNGVITLKLGSHLVENIGDTTKIGEIKEDKTLSANASYDFKNVAEILTADGTHVEFYSSLAEAIAAVNDNQTIKLLDDVTLNGITYFNNEKKFTVDGDGHTISPTSGSTLNEVLFKVGTENTATNTDVTFKNLTIKGYNITADYAAVIRCEAGKTSLDNVTFDGNTSENNIIIVRNSTLTADNCTFKSNTANCKQNSGIIYADENNNTSVTVTNSLFESNTEIGNGLLFVSNTATGKFKSNTFKSNTVGTSSTENTAVIYGSGIINVENNLFESNTINAKISSKLAPIVLGSGSKASGTAISYVKGNAFVNNTMGNTSANYAYGVYTGHATADLTANYWVDGTEPDWGYKTVDKDIYVAMTEGFTAPETYACAYTVNGNGRGVTVTLPTFVAEANGIVIKTVSEGSIQNEVKTTVGEIIYYSVQEGVTVPASVQTEINTKTSVTGVALQPVTTAALSNVNGVQAVVNAAKKQAERTSSSAAATAAEKATASAFMTAVYNSNTSDTTVTVKVDVQVKTKAYDENKAIKFDLTPYATVTIQNAASPAAVQTVAVTNDMIDQSQDIMIKLYTGFEPVQLIHRTDSGDTIETFSKADTASYANKTFSYDAVTGTCTVYVRHFSSIEAVSTVLVPANSTGSSGGGSSSYTVSIGSVSGGTVKTDKTYASAGTTVTLTVTPAEGYSLALMTVKDSGGKAVTVTKVNATTYTFAMPSSKVTIEPSFVIGVNCPQDNTCVYAKFTDADTREWYHDGVHFCVEYGYMNGISAVKFAPNANLSRAMIVMILWNMEGKPAADYAMTFGDVKTDWYTEAIRWAQSTGVVTGYTSEKFGPMDNITREQLAAILYRYAAYKKVDVTASNDLAKFADADTISDWALKSLQWANAVGMVNGRTTTTIAPLGTASRAEAACMVQRFCENVLKQ